MLPLDWVFLPLETGMILKWLTVAVACGIRRARFDMLALICAVCITGVTWMCLGHPERALPALVVVPFGVIAYLAARRSA